MRCGTQNPLANCLPEKRAKHQTLVQLMTKQTFAINLFQEKMPFTCETSTIEKDAKYRSETKNIQFFSYNVNFVFQKISNNGNILRKINLHIKAIKARIACLIFNK